MLHVRERKRQLLSMLRFGTAIRCSCLPGTRKQSATHAHLPSEGRQPQLGHPTACIRLQLRHLLLRRQSTQQRFQPLLSGQRGV